MTALCFILGTRPEIVKLSPLIRRARGADIPLAVIHTGQHYDHSLDGVFFEDCGLREPEFQLNISASSHGEMLGRMFMKLEPLLLELRPNVAVVEGDTNSVFAGAFIANRLDIPVAHVEAGLRSDDWTMPEEVNRVLTDRLSTRLYAPTRAQVDRLNAEGIPNERILLSGNTILNAVLENLTRAKDKRASSLEVATDPKSAVVITLHRPALVDDVNLLGRVLRSVSDALERHNLSATFVAHPRTRKTLNLLEEANSWSAIELTEPIGYLSMLTLLSNARLLITDSGGLQEEASILHVPCVTIRENTERPETLHAGGNIIAGFGSQRIERAVDLMLKSPVEWKPLYEIESPADCIFADLVERYG